MSLRRYSKAERTACPLRVMRGSEGSVGRSVVVRRRWRGASKMESGTLLEDLLHPFSRWNCITTYITLRYHHGGLAYSDRQMVERLFQEKLIYVICTTSTLALGVNLPAHLVIIKGTRYYEDGEYKGMCLPGSSVTQCLCPILWPRFSLRSGFVRADYSYSALLQMVGRAGRPQFDTVGKAVLMTSQNAVDQYRNIVSNNQPIESVLHRSLGEYLNSEIAIGTLSNLEDAHEWIKTTFLFQRLCKNPTGTCCLCYEVLFL